MKAVLKKYHGENVISEEVVELPDDYDGDPYGDKVPFVVASNWSLVPIEEGDIYIHPQETWSAETCAKAAKSAPKDAGGNKFPAGLINCDSSPYPRYGQTRIYNGGTTIDGKRYRGERIPLPKIPDDYEFVTLVSWGTRIQKKGKK